MNRAYKCAPLPFMGQKRYFLRDFAEVLERVEGQIDTVVDLFGGSGLLSHTAKAVLPGCKVVYNDYDIQIQNANAHKPGAKMPFDCALALMLNVVGVAKLRKNAE